MTWLISLCVIPSTCASSSGSRSRDDSRARSAQILAARRRTLSRRSLGRGGSLSPKPWRGGTVRAESDQRQIGPDPEQIILVLVIVEHTNASSGGRLPGQIFGGDASPVSLVSVQAAGGPCVELEERRFRHGQPADSLGDEGIDEAVCGQNKAPWLRQLIASRPLLGSGRSREPPPQNAASAESNRASAERDAQGARRRVRKRFAAVAQHAREYRGDRRRPRAA